MVDKKLSEFSQITPEEIAKLICLYLDENDAIKNGVVDFAALDALLAHKAGNETFTGNKTFSGETVFSGNATFNNTINGNISGKAPKDGDGNTISSTYAKLAANNTITGDNTFSGDVNFNGNVNLPSSTYLKPQDNNIEGGEIHFIGAPNEPNSNKSISIDRYNGTLRFFGFSSGDTPVNFEIDMQNDSVGATTGVKREISKWGIPNYGTVFGISSGYTATSNGIIRFFYKESVSCSVTIGGITPFAHAWAGGDYGNQTFMSWLPIAKGQQITFSGIESCYFDTCYGG